MSIINVQSISIFHQVDSFVSKLLSQMTIAKILNLTEIIYEMNRLYKPFYSMYDSNYWYSESIHAFVGATQACIGYLPYYNVIWTEVLVNQFLYYLKSFQAMVRHSLWNQQYQEMNNRNELESYVRQILNKYSKSLVVMVTLSYQPEYRSMVSLEQFQAHIEKLRELISNKQTCFKELQGYAWAIEQGVEKGLHCHLWLAYNGAKRQSDFYIGKDIGEKWLKITGNLGEYHNSNDEATKTYYASFGSLGIGRIHRDNLSEIENAVSTALYLAKPEKDDQYLVIKLAGMRTFGKGIYR